MSILAKAKKLLEKYGPQKPGEAPLCGYQMGGDLKSKPPTADCSFFVAEASGQPKMDKQGRWWNTDRIYRDALGANERWRQIAGPMPGCIGVYPGKVVNGERTAGHVWVVLDPAMATTIECSSSGKGINKMTRAKWFKVGATGNGKPIIFAEFVG